MTDTQAPKLMKRRNIRKDELLEVCERQNLRTMYDELCVFTVKDLIAEIKKYGVCDYSGERIGGQDIDFDHKIPNAMLYEGDEIKWEIILRKWHKVKTAKDVKDIAKAKRMAGEKGQYARRQKRDKPLIQDGGFQKKPEGYKTKWPKRKFGQ